MFKDETDFEKLVSRLDIDAKPSPEHRQKLRLQMLSAFTGQQRRSQTQPSRRTIMRGPIPKLAAAAAVIIVVATGAYYFTKTDTSVRSKTDTPVAPGVAKTTNVKLVPIDIKLPKPMFVGTPQDTRVKNLEKPTGKPRPPFYAPEATKNVAYEKPISSTDEEPIIGELEMITDGDKEAADGSYVELGPFKQSITIDLGAEHNIYAIVMWHYHKQARVYFDVVVQVADDPDFIDAQTLFNNDIDNSAGFGVGKDMHYTETNEGKLIDAKGVQGRYVRLCSNGNNNNDLNHYIEVEVYGKQIE